MYVLVFHRISDPCAFWRIRERPDPSRPLQLRLVHALPSRDHTALVCIWESDSVETVRSYTDRTYGDLGQNEHHEIDEGEALGCWFGLGAGDWSFRASRGFLVVEQVQRGALAVTHTSHMEDIMSSEQNKQVVRSAYQAVSEGIRSGDFGALDEVVASDLRDHNPDRSQEQGLDGLKQWFSGIGAAFPDLQITVEDLIAEGDKVVGRVTFRGTHSREFQGIPATGKQMEILVIDILRVEGGKIVERWGVADNLAMMQQLGLEPT